MQAASLSCRELCRALLKNKTANEARFSDFYMPIFNPCVNQICYMILKTAVVCVCVYLPGLARWDM